MGARTDTLSQAVDPAYVATVLDSYAGTVLQRIVDGVWPSGIESTELERVVAARVLTKRHGG